jgi:RimJ/RimL family protein N-acetyltransferase
MFDWRDSFLKDDVIALKSLNTNDLIQLLQMVNNQKLTELMTTGTYPISYKKCLEHHVNVENEGGMSLGIHTPNGTSGLKGVIELNSVHKTNRTAKISILIREQGQGLGTRAIELLTEHCFNRLNLQRVQAGTSKHNTACIRAFEKAGYHQEANLERALYANGVYQDIVVLARLKGGFV